MKLTPAEYAAKWRRENPDKARESKKRWLEEVYKDPEKVSRYRKARRARVDKWRALNPEKVKAQNAAQHKRSYLKHREKILRKKREEAILYRKRLVNLFGGKCVSCGFSDWRALQVDHIKNDGYKDMKNFSHERQFYNYLIKEGYKLGDKYQLLCANCNWIKRYSRNGAIL